MSGETRSALMSDQHDSSILLSKPFSFQTRTTCAAPSGNLRRKRGVLGCLDFGEQVMTRADMKTTIGFAIIFETVRTITVRTPSETETETEKHISALSLGRALRVSCFFLSEVVVHRPAPYIACPCLRCAMPASDAIWL
eukprot:2138753-Rhodomonas_salina.1